VRVSFQCLCSPELFSFRDSHERVMDHFGVSTNYTQKRMNHGMWMNEMFQEDDADILFFVDCDCIPLNREIIDTSISLCENGYLVGNAQVSNHLPAKHMLFCAPSFLCISRNYYERIGRPSCINNNISDVGQELTREANRREMRTKMFFPNRFSGVPIGGIWRLGGYGYYGLGTIFQNSIYHQFQSSRVGSSESFQKACELTVKGKPHRIPAQYDSLNEYKGILPIENEYGDR